MTDPEPPTIDVSPIEPEPQPKPAKKRDYVPWLYGFGLLVLAGVVLWLVNAPTPDSVPDPRIAALEGEIAQLRNQVTALEHRPVPDLAPLAARITALEQKPPPVIPTPPPPPDLRPLEARIAKLEAKPDPTLPDAVTHPELAALAGRMDAIAGRQDAETGRLNSLEATVKQQFDALGATLGKRIDTNDTKIAGLDAATGKITAISDRAGRIARLQAARAALDSGQPLGDIAGAPAALTRFAAAAQAAQAASHPADGTETPLIQRMWDRAQDMVTVRQGDHVIVGDPAAGIVARARHALDAGDLAGAVAALSSLTGPAATAMAGWIGQAKALLDARAALNALAAAA